MGQHRHKNTDIIDAEIDKNIKKTHKCSYEGCNAIFLRPNRLISHLRVHTGEKPFKCTYPDCDRAYTNSSHLKRHMTIHTSTSIKIKCPHCSLMISNRHNLKRHYDRVHKNPQKLVCTECGTKFSKKYQLSSHVNTHMLGSYKCKICNKVFPNFSKFKRHEVIHSEKQKKYPCTVLGCTELFDKWLLCCKHIKEDHFTEYKCNECGKLFLHKSQLKIHAKIHLNNRPVIPCPYDKCHRAYLFQSSLDQHVKSYHLGVKFECDICKAQICTKKKLAEHIQKLHMFKKRHKAKKKTVRKERKDLGQPKRSTISHLLGVNFPVVIEKQLMQKEAMQSSCGKIV